ncbi:MAG TPA: carboxypeptidase-like regulatory domain-containing protein [Candidatus Binatia bacterium]|nr:carboxypeptidase-like regulatory domain-containing protein [Candidatus Binatia bacterium]
MTIGALCRRAGFGSRAIALTLACTIAASPALGATQTTLGGKIVNAAGSPVRGAKVMVLQPGSSNLVASATTGDNGLYAIERIATGRYDLRVEPGVRDLRGDTAKIDVTPKGLVVNWRLSANDKAVALAIPGKVGGEEDELCSPVTIGDYEVNRCVLAGGALLVAGGIAGGIAASEGGGGGGGAPAATPTITGTRPTATATGTRPTATATGTLPTATATGTQPTATATGTHATPTMTGTLPTATATTVPPTATVTTVPPTVTETPTVSTPTMTGTLPTATATTAPPTATPTGPKPTETESVSK